MITRAFVTPQVLTCALVTIAMVFCHELTLASWCWAVSASLEVNLLLGNKSSPVLHIQNEQLFLDSSTVIVSVEIPPSLPICPM